MIDERSLLAAIKDAWRTGGYSVVGNGGELVLQGSGWLAVLPRAGTTLRMHCGSGWSSCLWHNPFYDR